MDEFAPFHAWLQARYAPATVKRYANEVRLFARAVAHHREATYADVLHYIENQRVAYSNPQTVATVLHAVKSYYAWLLDSGQRADHPCRSIQLKDKVPVRPLSTLFSRAELQTLLQRTERYGLLAVRNRLILSLLITQALTVGELARLGLEHLSLAARTLTVLPSRMLNGRLLPLAEEQLPLLENYLQKDRPRLLSRGNSDTQGISSLLLTHRGRTENGENIHYLVSTFQSAFPDRKLNPKTIRQSVLASMLAGGYDLRYVQVFAGHKHLSSTQRYLPTTDQVLWEQIQQRHPLA